MVSVAAATGLAGASPLVILGVGGRQRLRLDTPTIAAHRTIPNRRSTDAPITKEDYSIFTEMDFFFASSVFGMRISSTPSLKDALISLLFTSQGKATVRKNDP